MASSKNVDNSDIVLKGDVVQTLKRNGSVTENYYKQLKVGEFSYRPNNNGYNSNMRYCANNEDNCTCSEAQSSKNSPDLNKHTIKTNSIDYHYKVQQDTIEQLKRQVNQLQEKLKFYENNCKCLNKKTCDKSIETIPVNFSLPKKGSTNLKETAEFCFQNDKEVGDRGKIPDPNLNSTSDYRSLFNLSPDNYSSNVLSIGRQNKKYEEHISNAFPSKVAKTNQVNYPLDHSNELEQQSSKYYDNNPNEKSAEIDLTLSNVNLNKLKHSPFRELNDKSPILNQEETDELFKSRNRIKQVTDLNDSDDFSNDEKMINPFDKSSMTPNYLLDSDNKSAIKRCVEDWTMDTPKIKYGDRGTPGSDENSNESSQEFSGILNKI